MGNGGAVGGDSGWGTTNDADADAGGGGGW